MIFAVPDAALMTTLRWLLIPGFLVPLLLLTHVGVFYRLARAQSAPVHAHAAA